MPNVLRLFVFNYRGAGDYSYAVMAHSIDEAIDAVVHHQRITGEGSWNREELADPLGHFGHECFAVGDVASFSNY